MLKRLFLGLVLMTFAAGASAQSADLTEVLSGKSTPLTLQLKDLNSDWRRMHIGAEGKGQDLGSLLGPLMQIGMMSEMGKGNAKKDDTAAAALGMMVLGGMFGGGGLFGGVGSEPVYYTKGQSITVGGEIFMVTYKANTKQPDLMKMIVESSKNGNKPPDFAKIASDSKLTPDTTLALYLLNMKTVGSMHDIRQFDLQKEIDESGAAGGLMDLLAAQEAKPAENAAAPGDNEVTAGSLEVESILLNDKILSDHRNAIEVTPTGNSVRLTGHVATATMKQRATNLASKALKDAGMNLSVKNELKVGSGK